MAGSQMEQGHWGQGGTDDGEGWDGRVQEGQMAVAGVVGWLVGQESQIAVVVEQEQL